MSKSRHEKRRPVRGAPARATALAHLDAVMDRAESLQEAGRLDEALQLLETNLARLGQFAPLRAGLALLYGEVGRYRDAAVEGRLAMEMDPRQPDYYLIAALAYAAAGYYTFAHRARQQWLRFSPQDPMVADMHRLDDEYRRGSELLRDRYRLRDARVAEEAGYLLDEGRWALDGNRWAEALRYSQQAARLAPGWPPPRNNASSALYYLRRYDEAIANAETVLRECDPDNLHALANLVRYYATTGDLTRAHQCADRLAALPWPADLTEVVKQIEGLSVLDRDAEIGRLAAEAHKQFRDLPGEVYVHWGIALANSGRRREALKHLRRAQEAGDKSSLL